MDLHAQFSQLQPIRQLERTLVRAAVGKRNALATHELELLMYALNVARLSYVKTKAGDVDVFETVAPFRHWLIEQMDYFVDPSGERGVDWKGLHQLIGAVGSRVRDVRTHLLEHHAATISLDRFEREVTRKELVLVLGGGGGSGYAHLGALGLVAEMGLTPGLIVGASMGALVGLFRAERRDYDPVTTALALPRPSEWSHVFSPYRGYSKFGFPGTIELKARTVGTEIFEKLIGRPLPAIQELAIPYRAVVTGLRSGIGLALGDVERRIEHTHVRRRPQRFSRQLGLFLAVVRKMLENPRFLDEIVFGSDEHVRNFNAIDAMGFSCAVPGIIHYDLYDDASESADQLRALFADRHILRLTDGGVVSNVPARVAWQTVQRGEIGYRNSFILAFDAFAPVVNLNAPFVPIQQLVRRSTLVNRPYCDHLIAYRQPPAPFQLLQSLDTLQRVISRVRNQLKPERPFIERMTKTLPRWGNLERAFPEGFG